MLQNVENGVISSGDDDEIAYFTVR